MSSKKAFFNNVSLILGVSCAIITLVIMVVSGSPFDMLHKTYSDNAIPPIWVWGLSSILLSFLSGCGAGILLGNLIHGKLSGNHEHSAYKGMIFFVALFFLSNAHYPIFFVAERFFISLIISVVAIAAAVLCALFWAKPSPLSTVLVSLFALWQMYVTFINVCVLLKI